MATSPSTSAVGEPAAALLRRPAALIVVALILLSLLVLGASRAGFLNGWFSSAAATGDLYEVKPLTFDITLDESGELRAKQYVELKSEVEGESVIKYLAGESSRVKKGDLVVELASDNLIEKLTGEEIELRKVRADLESARQELDIIRNENASKLSKCGIDLEVAELELRQYLEGEFIKLLQTAEIDIEQTRSEIERKREEIRKNEPLHEKGFVTLLKLNELKFELYKLEKTLEKNELTKHILLEYDRPKVEKQKRSAVDQAREELARERKRGASKEVQAVALVEERADQLKTRELRIERTRNAIEKCKIFAPGDGIVQYPNEDGGMRWGGGRSLGIGEKVFEGQVLLVLPDTSQMVVSARIHEADRHRAREGMSCLITVPAVPGTTFRGQIAKIAQFADSAHRWLNPELKEHATEILLDQTDAPVSPGDSANITILIETVTDVLAVPVQAIYPRGSRSFVFVQRGRELEPVQIEIGRTSVRYVEVVSGLQAGDRVLQRASEALLGKLPAVSSEKQDREGGEPGRRGGKRGRPA